MENNKPNKLYFWIILLVAAGAMTSALLLQSGEQLEPCPLCVVQRVVMIAILVLAFFALILPFSKRAQKIYLGFVGLVTLSGMGVAGRHIWLQNLPPSEVPECGPTLNYILENFPLSDALSTIFRGTGQCAEVVWTFLSLSIPEWAMVAFVLVFVTTVVGMFKS